MRSVVRTVCALALLGITPAQAMDPIRTAVPNAQIVGQGVLSVMVWEVYSAKLYAPHGQWNEDSPFALQLLYLQDLAGQKIADRSVQEMRKQGFRDEVRLADWHTQMSAIFPDVYEGTVLTGLFTPGGETVFFEGEREIGRIRDPEFGRSFFDIWLGEKTSAPDLRRKLLGM